MGCCENRDKSPKPVEQIDRDYSLVSKEAKILNIQTLSNAKDKKILDIFTHIKELDAKEDWELVKKEENLEIKKRLGSKYSSDLIVSKLQFTFDSYVPLIIVLDELNLEAHRKQWDTNFAVYENIEEDSPNNFLLYSVFSILFFKTEYLERKSVILEDSTVSIVVYSVEDDRKPITKSITRAHTHLSIMAISEKDGQTQMTVFNQTDPNSTVGKMGTTIGITKLSDWANALKKRVAKVMNTHK
ncbi:hypothetical protein SteCoe_17390 [Stentor coeruleus]|uniref:START domain-containing protein n=1 Tax=Stentor coeruleus TaxID=5963 RepID=A0A1R2BZA9_9CILI|nr:hypothetical protein SteCoe_17390 [Stentor coeruleus]